MMSGPFLFGLLVSLAIFIAFVALSRMVGPQSDPIKERLKEYGLDEQGATLEDNTVSRQRGLFAGSFIERILNGFGFAPRLALELSRADLRLTVVEFALITIGLALFGVVLGTLRLNILVGLFIGAAFAVVPWFYLQFRKGRRQREFTEQLPDALTLMVGGLRGGSGLMQSLQIVVERLDPPASTEFARVVRAVELGLPVQDALTDMAHRVGLDEFDLVVTAINVQYELGGNLAQTLDTISETIRERLRILRDVRVLTSHQRLTAYVLAGVPVGITVLLFILSPEYMVQLFAPDPPWIRLLPIGAVVLMFIGTLVMRRIVDIEV